jgi:TonB family protein
MFSTASSGRLHGIFMQSDQRRMSTALLIAVLLHGLLLSVTLGGQTFGLPGFKLPWKERRLSADELQVMLAPLPRPTPPAEEANPVLALKDVSAIGSTVSSLSTSPTSTPLPNPKPAAESAPASAVEQVMTVKQALANLPTAPVARRFPTHTSEAPSQSMTRDVAPPPLEQAVQDRAALDQAGREQETQRAENLRRTESMAAAQREAARQELLRVETARAEQAAKDEAARQEQAKQAQREAQRQEALRQEQAHQAEKARQAAEKQEQERADAVRRDAAQQDKAKQEAEREERLKAIGKQLDREAAQRDAVSTSSLPSASSLRRGWLFGRADANRDLVLYAETMSQKIEKNMTFEMIRELIKQAYNRPTVTIAVRADGTVEKVSFVTSSGVAAIDEAVRKVIASQAPYGAFPPSLARQYDVIEIRRTWVFDIAIRLQ